MTQILIMLGIALTAVLITTRYRTNRDRETLTERVRQKGGQVMSLTRVRKGSPFADTTRGWWAWRVTWQDGTAERTSWALTTRVGIKEWRD